MLKGPARLILSSWALAPFLAWAQDDSLALRYAATIAQAELRQHVEVLASDSFLGRETGKEGQKLAADYLVRAFKAMGIPPIPEAVAPGLEQGYLQPFDLVEENRGSISLAGARDTLRLLDGLFCFNEVADADREVDAVRYLGKWRKLDKRKAQLAPGETVVLDGAGMGSGWAMMPTVRSMAEWASGEGAALLIVLVDDLDGATRWFAPLVGGGRMRLAAESDPVPARSGKLQLLLVERARARAALGLKRFACRRAGSRMAARFRLQVRPQAQRYVAENVLAWIEGSDLRDETVVVTAHYDHLGAADGEVHNGADDNASGTAALLGIAQAFARAKAEGHGPRRSVLIMPVSGEEKGLLGSQHYSEHPVFPLQGTVADLNIDMIGRTDSAHAGSPPYIYVIGSDRLSTELHAINEEQNARHVGLVLDYTFNADDDPNRFYYRSDHYNFARKGIPSIFYFSGVHEDYHKPTDDAWKIQYDLVERRARLVFLTAWALANRPERIRVDRPAR